MTGDVVRLVAVDVDGTLLDRTFGVSAVTRAAIARARSRGVEVLPVTSRGAAALLPVLRRLATPDAGGVAFVAAQGALIATGEDVRVLRHRPIDLDTARAVAGVALAGGFAVSWYAGSRWYVSHLDSTIARESRVVRVQPELADLASVPTAPDKLMVIAAEGTPGRLAPLLRLLPDTVRAEHSNPGYLEVTAAGVHKGEAVAWYAARAGVPRASVAAIGDGLNDLAMFAVAGLSVAVANAHPDVLAAADRVTGSNVDDGVAEALDRLTAGR